MLDIICGADPREPLGFEVCRFSALRRTTEPLNFIPLREKSLRYMRLYTRPHERRGGQLWCPISNAPMATDFANSRFLGKWLSDSDWCLFCDFSDMLFLADPAELFALADERYAVMVVQREHIPEEGMKMDGQLQTIYSRKQWSSVVLWQRKHPANERLTLDMVNNLPGRDLHRFCWLQDDEIGNLPRGWNFLVGVDNALLHQPLLMHYTSGTPELLGDECPSADVWLREREIMEADRRYPPAAE